MALRICCIQTVVEHTEALKVRCANIVAEYPNYYNGQLFDVNNQLAKVRGKLERYNGPLQISPYLL